MTCSVFLSATRRLFHYMPHPDHEEAGIITPYPSLYTDQDLFQDDHPHLRLPKSLPREIIDLILFDLVHIYFRAHSLTWASYISTVSKKVGASLYALYIGKPVPSDPVVLYRHLSRTFLLVNTFYDEYITEDYTEGVYPCLRIFHPDPRFHTHHFQPHTLMHTHHAVVSLEYLPRQNHPLNSTFLPVRISMGGPMFNSDVAFLKTPIPHLDHYRHELVTYPLIWITIDTFITFIYEMDTPRPTFFLTEPWNRLYRLLLVCFGPFTTLLFTYESEETLHYYLKRAVGDPPGMITTEAGTF